MIGAKFSRKALSVFFVWFCFVLFCSILFCSVLFGFVFFICNKFVFVFCLCKVFFSKALFCLSASFLCLQFFLQSVVCRVIRYFLQVFLFFLSSFFLRSDIFFATGGCFFQWVFALVCLRDFIFFGKIVFASFFFPQFFRNGFCVFCCKVSFLSQGCSIYCYKVTTS